MKKTVLPLLILCVCLICGCLAVTASADTPECIIRGENVVATPDTTVTMEVTIENNPGISGAELIVSFDERLTLVNAESGDAFSALTYMKPSYYRNPTIFEWDSVNLHEEDIKDGVVLTLTFHVAAGAEGELPVVISYEPGYVYDKDLNELELTTVNGSINGISYMPGDADGNGRLATLDITAIRRWISDGRRTDPNGYNISINQNAADVDANSKITTLDILMIRRFISDGRKTDPEGYNVVLLPGKMACTHNMAYTAANAPTCTEPGNTEYWYCDLCNKYFADEAGKYEILFENTQLEAGHSFDVLWSYDEYSHWHDATCEHKDQPADLADHTFVDHKCTVCDADETVAVTFVDYEGAVIDTQYVPYGTGATAPEVPDRLGYVFDRWDADFDAVTEDVTITAQYSKAHIVIFADTDGTVLKQESVLDGGSATPYVFGPTDVPPEGFDRVGWDKPFDNITADTVIYVNYEKKSYPVSFYMPDGTWIETQSVEHGSHAVAPVCDEIYFDWNTHKMGSFSGWSASLEDIKGEQSIYAEYKAECDQPVISIETTNNSASIKMYAPEGCYLYAIDFGFDWSGNISILSCDKNIASNLYKGNDGAANIDFNNKYNTFHYTWTNAAGVKLEGAYTTVLDIQFVTDGDHVVNKDVLKLLSDCSIIFSTRQTSNMDELETVTPVVVMK